MISAEHYSASTVSRQPERSCVICRRRLAKQELLRHVVVREAGVLVSDAAQRLPGRGFYVCEQQTCRQAFSQYKGWRRKVKGVAHDTNQS